MYYYRGRKHSRLSTHRHAHSCDKENVDGIRPTPIPCVQCALNVFFSCFVYSWQIWKIQKKTNSPRDWHCIAVCFGEEHMRREKKIFRQQHSTLVGVSVFIRTEKPIKNKQPCEMEANGKRELEEKRIDRDGCVKTIIWKPRNCMCVCLERNIIELRIFFE